MGILGDFILSLQEIHFVALFARNGEHISISFRNNCPTGRVSRYEEVHAGVGHGGGHDEMAGGILLK